VVKNDLEAMRLVFYASMFIDRKRGIAYGHILTDMTESLELNGLQLPSRLLKHADMWEVEDLQY
jgi:hypothetical protein